MFQVDLEFYIVGVGTGLKVCITAIGIILDLVRFIIVYPEHWTQYNNSTNSRHINYIIIISKFIKVGKYEIE